MAFPTTSVLNDFSPDDAAPMAGWTDLANGISAVSGLGAPSVAGAYNVSYFNTSYGPIQSTGAEVYTTISTKMSVDGNIIAIALLIDPANGYGLYLIGDSGADIWQILRFDGGVPTIIASGTQEISNGDSVGLEIIGTGANNIKAYYKPGGGSWGVLGQVQDTTHSGNVYPGLSLLVSGSEERVGDFGGGTVATATTIGISDAGAGADVIGQVAVVLALSDAGAGADGFSGQAALALADSAAGADGIGSPTVILQLADAGAGGDFIQFLQALLQAADSGAGLDALSIAVNLSISDAGAGADAAMAYVLIQISDAGSAADAVPRIAAALSIADAGAGLDTLAQILAALSLADSGAGIDSISVAQGGDVRIVYDAATGADSLGIVVQIALADSAASADLVAQLRAALAISDAGGGIDAASIAGRLASIPDSGTGADLVGGIFVSLTLADAGAAADLVAQVLVGLPVSDAGVGADTAAVITFLARGKIRITFTARRPGATITAKRPGMAMTARRPGMTFH